MKKTETEKENILRSSSSPSIERAILPKSFVCQGLEASDIYSLLMIALKNYNDKLFSRCYYLLLSLLPHGASYFNLFECSQGEGYRA